MLNNLLHARSVMFKPVSLSRAKNNALLTTADKAERELGKVTIEWFHNTTGIVKLAEHENRGGLHEALLSVRS